MTKKNEKLSTEDIIIVLFGLSLLGSLVLPIIPAWKAFFRAVALVTLAFYWHGNILPNTKQFSSKTVYWLIAPLYLFCLYGLLSEIFSAPLYKYFFDSAKSSYGVPIGFFYDLSLLAGDTILIVGFFSLILKKEYLELPVPKNWFLLTVFCFWAWSHVPVIKTGLFYFLGETLAPNAPIPTPLSLEFLDQQITGLLVWNGWILVFLNSLVILRTTRDVYFIFKIILIGIFFQASVVVGQWIIEDYSYIISHLLFDQYFKRVQGTHFYHGAVDLFLLLGLFLALVGESRGFDKKKIIILMSISLIGIYFNSTRAIGVGLISSVAVYSFFWILRKQEKSRLIPLGLVFLLFVNSIFYLKAPQISTTPSPSEKKEEKKTSDKIPSMDVYVVSNGPRVELLLQGWKSILNAPFAGQGVGTTQIPLSGKQFNGAKSTYSSHALFPDLALNVGIPGLLFFLLGIGLLIFIIFKRFIKQPYTETYQKEAIAWLGFFAVIFSTSPFFSQETNYTMNMLFVCFSLILFDNQTLSDQNLEKPLFTKKTRPAFTLLIVVGLCFALMISSYIFSALELLAKSRRYPERYKISSVHTNSTTNQFALNIGFFLMGRDDIQVRVLPDDITQWPKSDGWILWYSKNDFRYPNVRKQFNYAAFRGYSPEPSFKMPANYWLLPTKRSTYFLIKLGCWRHPRDLWAKQKKGTGLFGLQDPGYFFPNVSGRSEIFDNDPENTTAPYLGDKRLNTGWVADANDAQFWTVFFDVGEDMKLPIATYGIAGIEWSDFPGNNRPSSWILEGSTDMSSWTTVDKRDRYPNSITDQPYRDFKIKHPGAYRYYRFRFFRDENSSEYLGLAEIELYPKCEQPG